MSDPERPDHGVRPPSDLNPREDAALDFVDKDLEAMTPEDYDAIGFLCGLEVHQQLGTRTKLFCRCPTGRSVRNYDAEVLRHMRPTLSELGEYDGTALMEFKTKKEIVYQLERGTVCTYEIDDTPPFEISEEAVDVALEIGMLLDLNLVSELHVMRKQYLDGSIPTGFQRTAMVGLSGSIPFSVPELGVDRALRIRQLSLEEDSCREVSDVGHLITFRTDRLGTPLTEVVTEPELYTPWEVREAGRLLAEVARATRKVYRGPGAARQDVNVSVAGGRRIEIKGVDHHRGLPRLVHVEAFRQLNLLRVRHALLERDAPDDALVLPDDVLPWSRPGLAAEVTGLVRNLDYAPVQDAVERGDIVVAVRLPGFAGLLAHRTQPGITFAREISDRLRVIACLEARPFMLHSDQRDYGLTASQWRSIRRRLHADRDDTIVVVWGPEADVATAAREIVIRAREAFDGIPSETRQAYPDGTNGFERILPGPDRMYPDTDTPPLPIAPSRVEAIRSRLPETPWAREARYQAHGLSRALARRLAAAPWAPTFDALDPPKGEIARRLAHAFEKRIPYLRREGAVRDTPSPDRLRPLLADVSTGRVRPEAIERAIDALLARPGLDAETVMAPFRRASGDVDQADLDRAVARVAERADALSGTPLPVAMRWAMGQVMPGLLGRVDPKEVRARLTDALAPVVAQEAK